MNARVAVAAALMGLAGCASAPTRGGERTTVEAEGWAALTKGDPYGPRARALADAQKRAVEKAAGVNVAASTRVDAAVAVRQRIWTDARARIESWELIGDRAEDGFRKLRIRAVVRLDGGDTAQPPPGDAKVRVASGGPAAAGLRRGLGEAGFILADAEAEYVATAETDARVVRDIRLAPFVTGRANVKVSIRDAVSGVVVWEQARDASGLDADPALAVARAGESAGRLAGRDAGAGLSAYLWRR